ncbi:hypothetical protein M885DRAFT_542424 [Pelagophyceae sp. CCMP2097]|nr:hypothetical protein M885DRAFT_542424 [Pelagophyceae sp. CCMP2097]
MRVVFSFDRVLRLFALVALSGCLALLLETQFSFARLSAWGFSVTIVCQLNNALEIRRSQRANDAIALAAIEAKAQQRLETAAALKNPKKKR